MKMKIELPNPVKNKINRGKDFEGAIASAFAESNIFNLRLHDTMGGQPNPCDFVAYSYPYMLMYECKSVYGNRFDYSIIRPAQYDGLKDAMAYQGILPCYFVWFIEYDKTLCIPAKQLVLHREAGHKSYNMIRPDELHAFELPGVKKRVLFEYDGKEILNTILVDFFKNGQTFWR